MLQVGFHTPDTLFQKAYTHTHTRSIAFDHLFVTRTWAALKASVCATSPYPKLSSLVLRGRDK